MTIGEKIYKIRTDMGLTQKDFAEKVGVSQSAINFWENGKRQPRLLQLNQMADALNISTFDLIDEEEYDSRFTKEFHEEMIKAREQQIIDDKNKIIENYFKLNYTGKREACKRIQELTELREYTKPEK